MDETPPALAERMQRALIEHMVRSGLLDGDDIAEICERLKADGDDAAAYEFACLMVRGMASEQSHWEADRARARFHTIAGGKSSEAPTER